jgi:hypothetical protein
MTLVLSKSIDSLSQAICRLDLSDPIMEELWADYTPWGFVDGILDEPTSCKVYNKWADFSVDNDEAIPTDVKPTTSTVVPATVVVPQFTVGIKTIITRNLPRDITVETIRNTFQKYGPIKDIYIPKNMDKNSPYFGTVKGFALIKFLQPNDSAKAYSNEYGRLTYGKNHITVEFANQDK